MKRNRCIGVYRHNAGSRTASIQSILIIFSHIIFCMCVCVCIGWCISIIAGLASLHLILWGLSISLFLTHTSMLHILCILQDEFTRKCYVAYNIVWHADIFYRGYLTRNRVYVLCALRKFDKHLFHLNRLLFWSKFNQSETNNRFQFPIQRTRQSSLHHMCRAHILHQEMQLCIQLNK